MSKSSIGVYAGSFDPPTNGHVWMIAEGARLFGKLIVAIGTNAAKKPTFGVEERLSMLHSICKRWPNVTVDVFSDEYLVRYASRKGASHILRGIRGVSDFHYEQTLRYINSDLDGDMTTVFLTPPRNLGEVSSSIVKGLIGPKGWEKVVTTMVPSEVAKVIRKAHGE